jgi:AcrR family transcriptional regulator
LTQILNGDSLLGTVAYRSTERTEARLAEARERIIEAARELIAEGGYVAAQIAAVAHRAGVAVGTVYRHFPSKSELFAEVFREASQHEVDAMRAAMDEIRGPAAERIAAGIEVFALRALRGRRLAWALLAEPVDPAVEAERLHFRHSYRDLMAEVVRDGIEAGDLPPQDAEASAAALIGAIGEAMLGPLSPTYDGSSPRKAGRSSRGALALRPRTDGGDPEALIDSLVTFCRRAIGEEHARVDA